MGWPVEDRSVRASQERAHKGGETALILQYRYIQGKAVGKRAFGTSIPARPQTLCNLRLLSLGLYYMELEPWGLLDRSHQTVLLLNSNRRLFWIDQIHL